MQEIAQSNKCISKMGSNISALFGALKVKPAGELTVLKHHAETQERMMERNEIRENALCEEGRLKVIKSDMKRADNYRNSAKDLRNVEAHLNSHTKRVTLELENIETKQPKMAKKLRVASVLPVPQV